ncbi:MAG: transporter substrate-binding domain-containing protein [Gammaproteobacteria bacterium]|nr:transporter substrate-binding domain-containing protein [Gammaproteobacteria bacterium]
MRQQLLSFIIIILLCSNLTATAETLNVVTGNDYKPFTDENLPEGGLSTAIVKRVFLEADIDISISYMPWARGYESTKNTVHFATFPYVKRADREKFFHFSQPVNTITQLVFVKKNREIKLKNADDLSGLSTCVPRGYAITESVATLINKGAVKKLEAPDAKQCYLMLKFGRVDFLTFNQYVGWSTAYDAVGKEADATFKTLEHPLETEGLYLIVSKSFEQGELLLSKFDNAMKKLRNNGIIQQIEKSYAKKIQQ